MWFACFYNSFMSNMDIRLHECCVAQQFRLTYCGFCGSEHSFRLCDVAITLTQVNYRKSSNYNVKKINSKRDLTHELERKKYTSISAAPYIDCTLAR